MTDRLGKMVSNSARWIMTVCTANADMIISPTVIIALGTIVFIFSILEVAIDYWELHERPDGHRG